LIFSNETTIRRVCDKLFLSRLKNLLRVRRLSIIVRNFRCLYSSSYTVAESAYAAAPDSNVVAPPNFDQCGVEKVTIIPHMHFDGSPFKFLLLNFRSLALLHFLSSICCLFMKEMNTNKRLMSPIRT
jgi:hypothetical protein